MTPTREGIDRRKFLELAASGSGLALWGCGAGDDRAHRGGPMRYRPLGRTGLVVSELTFGAHGVDNPPLMRAAIEAGVNTFFTSGEYLDGREERSLGQALRAIGARRDELVIITGSTVRRGARKQRILDDIDASLRRLGVDHLDVFCTFEVCSPSDLTIDALFEAFELARDAGKVGHLGLTGHCGGMQSCLVAAIEDGRFEVLHFKYDFVSYPDQVEILRRAAQAGIGAIVFKVNAGNRQKEIQDLESGGLSFRQASLKWALGNPDISSVAVTITNFGQIRECAEAVGEELTRPEVGMLRRYRDAMYDQYCRFCTLCETSCPHGVAVADVMRFAMYFKYYGRERDAMHSYGRLDRAKSASTCAGCQGPCQTGCPFGRPVRAELVEAHRMLSLSQT